MTSRIEPNSKEIARFLRDLRGNEKMNEKLRYEGARIAKGAGKGFTTRTMDRRRNRPGVIAYPSTKEAQEAQARENRLGKALGGLAK